MRTAVLGFHVVGGVVGLALGPLAMRAVLRAHRRTRLGDAYHWAVALVCTTAVALVPFDAAGLWWFVPIAIGSYAFSFAAVRAAQSTTGVWQTAAVRGVGGSYIALWTAAFVVSASALPVLWVAPTVIGVPIIEALTRRVARSGALDSYTTAEGRVS
jgi:hypothetical protein